MEEVGSLGMGLEEYSLAPLPVLSFFPNFFLRLNVLCTYMFCSYVCLCSTRVPGAHRGRNKA